MGRRTVATGCAAALALAACTGGRGDTPAPDGSGDPSGVSPDALVDYAATFPAMPEGVTDLASGDPSGLTFGSGTPYHDLEYTVFDTDYIEGETAGHDTFLPADPADDHPGAGERRVLEVVSNPPVERAYGSATGDRIILGDTRSARPWFVDPEPGEDEGYLVVRNLDYEHGRIDLPGAASDYAVVRAGPDDGAATDGWYLFWTADPEAEPDLVAFVEPCDAAPGNDGDVLCSDDRRLDLEDPDQFRFLGTEPPEQPVAVPEGLTQFGTPGVEIVHGVVRGDDGTTYVLGAGDGTLTPAGDGEHGVFVTALDPSGEPRWTTEVPLPNGALLFDAVSDGEHLYAVGRTFGALPGHTNAGVWDAIILKLRLDDGEVVATDQWGETGIDGYGTVTLDDAGHLYVAGAGSPEGGDGPREGGAGDNSFVMAKHSTDTLENVWRVVEPVREDSTRVAEAWGGMTYVPGDVPGDGRVVAGGWFIEPPNGAEAFVAMWGDLTASAPTRVATQVIGGQRLEADWVLDTAADRDGNVYAVGYTTGDLGGGEQAGEGDAYVVRFDPQLANPVYRQVGTPRSDQYRRLEIGDDGTLYAIGYTYGDLHGPNADEEDRTGDIVVDAFDDGLEPLASVQFGTSGEDRGYAAVDGDRIWVAAMTEGALAGPPAGAFDAAVVSLDAADLTVSAP